VRTGGIYSDLGLFTARESFGEDLTELFNLLTATRARASSITCWWRPPSCATS